MSHDGSVRLVHNLCFYHFNFKFSLQNITQLLVELYDCASEIREEHFVHLRFEYYAVKQKIFL